MLTDIERAAWATRNKSNLHKPEMACKVLLDQVERGELPTLHHVIVVAVTSVGDKGDKIQILQTGDLSEFAAEGVMSRAIRIMDGPPDLGWEP
jgi:hypothetical protein